MLIFKRLWRKACAASAGLILLVTVLHAAITYVGLSAAGEEDLVSDPITYTYFYMVTASTVGYGDLSPSTDAGRLFHSLFVIPFSLLIFGAVVGKIASAVTYSIERTRNGLGDFSDMQGHIVIFGFVPKQTARLIQDLRLSGYRQDIIVVSEEITDRVKGLVGVSWVWTDVLCDAEAYRRAAASGADHVIVMATDGDAFKLCAMLHRDASYAQVVAHVSDKATADILQATFTRVVAMHDNTTDELARAVQSPGAAKVLNTVATSTEAPTIMQMRTSQTSTVRQITEDLAAVGFRFVGYDSGHGTNIISLGEEKVDKGSTVYYIGVVS